MELSRNRLLGPTPVAGDPHEAWAVADRLAATIERLNAVLRCIGEAQAHLSANRSAAVTSIETKPLADASDGARLLLSYVEPGLRAFRRYGDQVAHIHQLAHAMGDRADELFRTIQQCAAQLTQIGESVGLSVSYDWRTTPPAALPELSATRHGELGDSEGGALRRHSAESDWQTVAGCWIAALAELESLQHRWNALHEERIDEEQRLVSVLDASQHAGRDHPLLAKLYREHAVDVILRGQVPAPAVARWWQGLDGVQRQLLIQEAPLSVGNLDGVPITARIAANAVSADAFARQPGIPTEEVAYWREVADGTRQLVVSDPEHSRIVEMIGQMGPSTAQVILYVPGTGAQMKHFYRGEVQQVSEYLVSRSSGEAVAFVYKDGSWVSWAGEHSNTNYEFLGDLGSRLAQFQRSVIDHELPLSGKPQSVIAHSAGMSVVSGAEQSGAEFDQVFSLGGAFMLPGWSPTPGTEYHHMQYENDMINRIDDGRLYTPHELHEVYEPHVFGAEEESELRSHGRIAEGPKVNLGPLEMLRFEMERQK